MLRFRLLLVALLGAVLQLAAAPAPDSVAWKRVLLPAGASAALPAPATLVPASRPTAQSYFATTPAATYIMVCALIDSTTYPYTNARLTPNELAKVYETNINALIGDEAQARVLRQTPFELAGQHGVEVEIALPPTASLGGTKFIRLLYASHYVYMLIWRATLDHPREGAADRLRFFHSLQVKAAPTAVPATTDARQAGRTTGRLVFYGLVLVIIVLLVRRFWSAR